MAVQLPNFLAAALQKPDYSGLADIVGNYYGGRSMPKDDLIKAVQAQFARPTAEAALQGAKLGNTKAGLDIRKLQMELNEQQDNAAQLRRALAGLPAGAQPAAMPAGVSPTNQQVGQPSMIQAAPPTQPAMQPSQIMAQALSPDLRNRMTMIDDPNKIAEGLHPELAQTLVKAMQGQQQIMPQQPQQAAPQQVATTPAPEQVGQALTAKPQEQVISEGTPALYGVDQLWETKPNLRPYLEKKGYKGEVKTTTDKKTGAEIVKTTYPSGRVVKRVVMPIGSGDETAIPLTAKMITTHQKVVSSVDNVLPTLEELRDLPSHANLYLGEWSATHAQKKYERLVNAAKESLIGAFSLNPTDSGLKTAVDQLTIGGRESEAEYKEAINDLIKHLKEKREYSAKEVKRSNKIMPVGRMGGSDYSDLDQFDQGGE